MTFKLKKEQLQVVSVHTPEPSSPFPRAFPGAHVTETASEKPNVTECCEKRVNVPVPKKKPISTKGKTSSRQQKTTSNKSSVAHPSVSSIAKGK